MELARTRREIAILLVAVLGFLGLFVTKAYAIDDPLFLWLAGNIREHPLDFYGFDVNWYGTAMPMHEVTMNPPLAGYYIAAVGALVGLSEVAVHTAFLLPVAAVCLGTYRLARDLCGRPLLASLMGLLTPVFLVASTSVMCDTLMLASWCWSVNCWRDGLSRERGRLLVLAGVLAALAGLTKYFGFALVPLLGLHGLLTRRRLGTWVLPLLIPVAAGVAYELGTAAMYGHGLISGAGRYAASLRESESLGFGPTFLSGLVFCGGCMATAIFLGPLLAGARWTLVGFGVLFLAALAIPEPHELLCHPKAVVVTNTHGLDLQILLMAYGGAVVTALGLAEVRRWRDPDSVLLGCWILGTLVFAACLNWVNNGRSILPMAPAVGIVLARRLELGLAPRQLVRRALVPALAASVLLAGVVTYADVRWANQSRRAASDMAHEYGDLPLFFYGHWGFQYYAQLAGARRFDPGVDVLRAGSVIVVPTNNYGTLELHPSVATQVSAREYRGLPWVHTASLGSGACFYANNIAPLPFAIGSALPDTYVTWKVHKTFHYAKRQAQGQGPGGAPPPTVNHESAQPPAAAAGGQPRR